MTPSNPFRFTRKEYNELVNKLPHKVQSQRSEYEEYELVEDCTLYDIYRQPRAPVTDPTVTRSLPVRVLNADLTCPICLGIIRQTEVVMECLHRFCSDCIQRSLRVVKNECPSCRMHIPSKRSLRRDTNFDELIAKIYPNLDEFTSQEEKLIEEINRERHCNNAFTESTKKGVQNQESQRRNNGKKKLSDESDGTSSPSSASSSPNGHASQPKRSWPADTNGSATDETQRKKPRANENGASSPPTATETPAATATTEPKDDKVNVRVLLHPEDSAASPKLVRTLFRTTYNLKIRHLKKHLAGLLKLPSHQNMRIVLSAKNRATSGLAANQRHDLEFDQELEDYVSLHDIYQQYGQGFAWELLLYYHFSDAIVNGVAQFIESGV